MRNIIKAGLLAAVLGLAPSYAGAALPQYQINLGTLAGGYYTNTNGYQFSLGMGQMASGVFTFLQTDASGYLYVDCSSCSGGSGSNAAAGAIGGAVPASASYTAYNSGGNLVGVSSANKFPVTDATLDAIISGGALPVSMATNTPTLAAGVNNVGFVGGAQGAAIGTTYGPMEQAEALSAAPSYTTATINPLTMTLGGGVRTADVNLGLAQGSTTSGQLGPIVQAAVITANPTYTTGQTSPLDMDTAGNLRVGLYKTGTNATPVGNFTTAGSAVNAGLNVSGLYVTTPLALTTGQQAALMTDTTSALYANTEGQRTSYRCTAIIVPAATPTDVFGIIGSATKTVKIHAIYLSTFATTAGEMTVQIAKRSTADGAGNSTPTAIPLDSNNAAGTAVCKNFTANPTTGTLVAYVDTGLLPFPTAALGTPTRTLFDYGTRTTEALVLRGVAQEVDINLAGGTLPAGASLAATIEWTEE